VDLKRHVGVTREAEVDVADRLSKDREELDQLGSDLRMPPQHVDGVLHGGALRQGVLGDRGDQHAHEPAPAFGEGVDGRHRLRVQQAEIGVDALLVIDVQEPAGRSPEGPLVRARGADRGAGRLQEVGPAPPPVVDVVEREPGILQKAREVEARALTTKRP
jgi:hypothetical protein